MRSSLAAGSQGSWPSGIPSHQAGASPTQKLVLGISCERTAARWRSGATLSRWDGCCLEAFGEATGCGGKNVRQCGRRSSVEAPPLAGRTARNVRVRPQANVAKTRGRPNGQPFSVLTEYWSQLERDSVKTIAAALHVMFEPLLSEHGCTFRRMLQVAAQ